MTETSRNIRTVSPAERRRGPGHSLHRDRVRFLGVAGTSVGIQAPAAGVSFLPALMAGIVAGAGPLSFAIAIVVMLFVAYAFIVYTREFAAAGSVYAYNGQAMGVGYGFVSAWLLGFVYLGYAGSVFASNANGVVTLVAPGAVQTHAWLAAAVGLWVLTIALAYFSIRISTLVIFAMEGAALLLVGIVAVAVIAHGGFGGHSLSAAPFTPHGLSIGTIGLGVVFAFTGFSGFEVAATLGEESRRATRIIPAAMVTALLVSGGIYTLMSWVETVAFPNPAALAAAAEHGVPLATIADSYLSPGMGALVTIAAILSGFGAQLATVNGAARLTFALARDGFGPQALTRVHPRYGSPVGALTVVAVLSIAPVLALYTRPALLAFQDLATYGADLIIVTYLMTLLGALVWSIRHRRLTPVRAVLLTIGLVLLGYVVDKTVFPLPAAPFDYYLYAAAATVAIGVIVITASPRLRRTLASSPLFITVRPAAE
jgi:amino acid transporter